MLETERAEYRVVRRQNNYLWLEVLRGGDQGMRVSVPIRDADYADHVQRTIATLDAGEVVEAVLVSEDERRPDWKVDDITRVEDAPLGGSARANA
jgi:uncharacterized protein (DUF1501 family)